MNPLIRRYREANLRVQVASNTKAAQEWERAAAHLSLKAHDNQERAHYERQAAFRWELVKGYQAQLDDLVGLCGKCNERPGTVNDLDNCGVCPECATRDSEPGDEEVAF